MQTPEFSFHTRASMLEGLAGGSAPFDALIVGGGIVGAGLARDLATRGLKPVLVEKGDFASGTSSRSSKLIHGGLRYLEMFDFRLVFEALSERAWLVKTHPHLVHPLEFDLPIYRHGSAPPGSRSGFILGCGLWLYDALSLYHAPFFHGRHSAREAAQLFPGLKQEGLKHSYYYADAMMLDDELVLENLADAQKRGARALNYVSVTKVSARGPDGLFRVSCADALTGRSFEVQAREVISCVGPWTELFGDQVAHGSGRKLKPSKGVHLLVPWKKFPVESCLVMNAPDGRIIFAIPRKDFGAGAEHVILGTTDSPGHETLESVHANKTDVEYLLEIVNRYFPSPGLRSTDIVMTYAGVRPLLDAGVASEAKTSREHEIWRNDAGIVFVAGGKYTTFRRISQEIADFTFPGTEEMPKGESKKPLSTPEEYAARFTGAPLWGQYTEGWIRWKLAHHAPCHLEDVIFRRIPLWMAGPQAAAKPSERIAEICQEYFGWSASALATEKAHVQEHFALAELWKRG